MNTLHLILLIAACLGPIASYLLGVWITDRNWFRYLARQDQRDRELAERSR